jgi:hypothetical protein
MWESVLSNLLAPVIIAGATAFFGFKWGRKKTSDELERSHTENATLIVNLVNKQLGIVYERVFALERSVATLKATLEEREVALEDKKAIIRAANECTTCPPAGCPVLHRQAELEGLNKKLRLEQIAKEHEITIKEEGAHS